VLFPDHAATPEQFTVADCAVVASISMAAIAITKTDIRFFVSTNNSFRLPPVGTVMDDTFPQLALLKT